MTRQGHAPGVWELKDEWNIIAGKRVVANCGGYSTSKDQENVALENSANAAHIVKCVNMHDELLEIIEELVECSTEPYDSDIQIQARKAIAKARGQV